MIMEKPCKDCPYLPSKDTEIAQLKQEVEFLYFILDLGMTAVEKWAYDNGLLTSKENLKNGSRQGSDQIRMLLDKIGKPREAPTLDRLVRILKTL